jgi:glycosyltransferase involved in cell wall biosynthesis
MVQAIVELLRDQKKLTEMGQKARQHVEKEFSLEKEISAFQNLYDTSFKQKVANKNN